MNVWLWGATALLVGLMPCGWLAVRASRVDALFSVCEEALARPADDHAGNAASTRQLVVHVDVGLLTGEQSEGRCQLEGGMPLSAAVARRLSCDCEGVTLTEREGLPIDVGRRRRVVSRRLRRALEWRDRTCRYPGCPVGSRRSDAHHLLAWALGGDTDLDNLIKLCRLCRRRHNLHYADLAFMPSSTGPRVGVGA